MLKLISGIKEFYRTKREEVLPQFSRLALGQKPDVLMIACSDSRVVPNLFASLEPGDLFVVRNVGNLIPPRGEPSSEWAAIEYALGELPIRHIIVCGHTECGACRARLEMQTPSPPDRAIVPPSAAPFSPSPLGPSLLGWLKHAAPPGETKDLNEYSKINIRHQIEKLKDYPPIQEKILRGELSLHGWLFDIKEVTVSEMKDDTFHPIR